MKNIFLLTLPVIILACEKEKNSEEIPYDFRIIRTYASTDQYDSTIYYYSSDNQLIEYRDYLLDRMHTYKASYETDRISIICESDQILFGDMEYFFSAGYRIDSIYQQLISDSLVLWYRFNYEENKIISAERRNTIPEKKYFYEYDGNNHVKDSVIIIPFATGHYTIVSYTYSDTLKPDYMVDESGLFEFPAKSNFLPREIITTDYIGGVPEIRCEKYSYQITDNEIEAQVSMNGSHEATLTYLLIQNE
jgi:hypothetical protein